jgi:D-glycero-D-manno-heptose 1,7-bisphosphate phosphatase
VVNKVCFIDRDGVINKLVNRPGMRACAPWSLDQFEFLPKVKEAIDNIRNLGYTVVVATNQPDPQDGLMPWANLNEIHRKILDTLDISDIYAAHVRGEPDYKPNNGMILTGIREYNTKPEDCWMIGDTWKDVVAGYRSRVKTIWINDGLWESRPECVKASPTYQCSSLYEASFIIEKENT